MYYKLFADNQHYDLSRLSEYFRYFLAEPIYESDPYTLTRNGVFETDLIGLDSVQRVITRSNPPALTAECLRKQAFIYFMNKEYDSVIETLSLITEIGQPISCQDYYMLGISYRNLKIPGMAEICLDSLSSKMTAMSDTLAMVLLKSLLAEDNGCYEDALRLRKEYDSFMNSGSDTLIINPPVVVIADYYGQLAKLNKTLIDNTRDKLWLWIVTANIVLLLIIGLVVLFVRWKRQSAVENATLIEDFVSLKQQYDKIQLNKHSPDFNPTFVNLLNSLFDIEHRSPESVEGNNYLRRNIKTSLLTLGSAETFSEIEKIVNYFDNDILLKLREQVPELSDRQIRYFALRCIGFSTVSICRILGLNTINAVHQIKSRSKAIIEKSQAENRDDFLKWLLARQI